jgi:hypothetical protein
MASKIADGRTEPLIQMATRIPRSLHRAVRVHCVEKGQTLMAFVVEACREKLRRAGVRRG